MKGYRRTEENCPNGFFRWVKEVKMVMGSFSKFEVGYTGTGVYPNLHQKFEVIKESTFEVWLKQITDHGEVLPADMLNNARDLGNFYEIKLLGS